MQVHEEQIRSLMIKGGWKEFESDAEETRMELTYQVLSDLTNINAAQQGQNQSLDQSGQAATPEQTKNKIVQNYIQNIQSIYAFVAESKLCYHQEQAKEYQADIQTLSYNQKELRSEELLQAQQSLNSQLQSNLANLRTFIESVGSRIKHQRYLNDQNQIQAYLQRQKSTFFEEKSLIEKHIRDHNFAVKQHIKIAQDICNRKQAQIQDLQTHNSNLQKQIQQTTSMINKINSKQLEIYKENSSLNQKNLALKVHQEAKHKQSSKTAENQSPKEENLSQSNLGSIILPARNQRKEESSISMPEIGAEEPQLSTKCEITTDDLKTELMARKMLILLLIITGVLIFAW